METCIETSFKMYIWTYIPHTYKPHPHTEVSLSHNLVTPQ